MKISPTWAWFSSWRFLPLLVGVLVIGLYTSSLDNPFMLEDHLAIVNHPGVVDAQGLALLWAQDFWAGQRPGPIAYRPFTTLTFYFNAQATGLSPLAFRLVNMALLAFLGCLVALWFSRYTINRTASWLAAGLFVAHPLGAEAINHLAGRAQILAMIGVVGFLLVQRLAIEATQHGLEQQRSRVALGVITAATVATALFWATIALFSSTTGLLIVPLAVLQAIVKPPRSKRPKPGWSPPQCWPIHILTAACLGLMVPLFFIAQHVADAALQSRWNAMPHAQASLPVVSNPLLELDVWGRIPAAVSLAWFYTRQLIWPSLGYSHTPATLPTHDSAITIAGWAVLLAVSIVLAATVYRRHWMSIAIGLALGQFVLVCHLVFPHADYASNRYAFPMTLAAALALSAVIDRGTRGSVRKRAVAVIPCAVALLLMWPAVMRVNGRWFSAPRLMASDLKRQPQNPVCMYNYGDALIQAGLSGRARHWLDQAVDRQPGFIQARRKLALVHVMRGDFSGASQQYYEVLELKPDDLDTQIQLTVLALAEENTNAAQDHLAAAKKIAPTHPEVLYNEARLSALRGDTPKALRQYKILLAAYPNHLSGQRAYAKLRNPPPTTQPDHDRPDSVKPQ